MAELALRPNPDIWTVLPGASDAAAWYEAHVAAAPDAARDAVAAAAALAVRARVGGEFSEVLLLSDPGAALYAMLGVLALDVAAPSNAAEALQVAGAFAPSSWQGEAVPFELGSANGWRVTSLDDETSMGDDSVRLPQTVSTVYVAELSGRCVIAVLSSLTPVVAAVVQRLAEQAVATFEVEG